MTARCEPPEGAADGSWHWLERDIGSRAAFQWLAAEKNPGWWRPGFFYPPADAHNIGWRYLAPIPSPDAVRALVEAARGAKEELSRLLDPSRVGFHETMRVLLPLSAALSAFPAQPESKS